MPQKILRRLQKARQAYRVTRRAKKPLSSTQIKNTFETLLSELLEEGDIYRRATAEGNANVATHAEKRFQQLDWEIKQIGYAMATQRALTAAGVFSPDQRKTIHIKLMRMSANPTPKMKEATFISIERILGKRRYKRFVGTFNRMIRYNDNEIYRIMNRLHFGD